MMGRTVPIGETVLADRTLMTMASLLLAIGFAGCGTIRVTSTSRSATEQLLLSSAFDSALNAIDLSKLAGRSVYLDPSALSGTDSDWMAFRIRQRMALCGVQIVTERDDAEVILEAGTGTYGTDTNEQMVGLPSNGVLTAFAGLQGLNTPEVALLKKNEQYGVVRLAMYAYIRETGQILWSSATIDADANLANTYVAGTGPYRNGTIEHPADRKRRAERRRLFQSLTPHTQ